MFKSILISIISFFITSKLYSQTLDNELINIVVTPLGFEQKIKNTNSFIKVITKKDIEKSSATNLVDLLKTESSIGIASTGGPGSVPSYFLRGFPKKYLKVTVDGMNIADPTATQAETYLQNISLDNIQKIEILKSPQGSVHGGQAAGGVIDITTDEGIFNGKKIRQKVKFGSNNSIYSGTYYSNGQKNVKMSISANISHSDGISSGNKNGLNTEKDAYNEGSITFKSTLKNDENTNKVTFVFRDSSSKYEYDKWDQTDNHDFNKTNIQSGLVTFEFQTGNQTKHILSYNPTRVNRKTAGSYISNQSSKQQKVEYKIQTKINKDDFVGVGIEYNNTKYKTSNVREKRESDAQYIYSQIKPTKKSLVDVSLRTDSDQIYGTHDSHRVQLGYDLLKNLKLKTSFGTGYRPPSLYESNNLASGINKLEPEITTNKELGFDYNNYNSGLQISSSIFNSEIDNEIEYSGGGYRQGSGFTEISGYEVSVNKYNIIENLDLYFSYTKTDSDKSNGTKGALVPMHKFTSLFDYKLSDNFNNQLEYIYQERAYDTSSKELPSFSLVNYNFNYKINDNFKSNFKISNILDQDYEVNRNYNTPGISFFGGVESEF